MGGENEPITVPCVKTYTQSRANWACSVHLYWNQSTLREQEAAKLAEQARQWQDAGIPVVLGGDFNGSPRTKTASYFYEPGIDDGGWGAFVEADETDKDHFVGTPCSDGRTRCRSGEPTFGTSKIDYLFLSARDFKGARADVLPQDTSVSDHRLVRGAAYWADCGPSADDAGAVFRRDANGGLFRYAGRTDGSVAGACKVGTGWSGMKLVARDGSAVVAVDGTGTLWRYPADAVNGTFSGSTRVQAGTGWQGYDVLVAPGDFSGDGKADLIARDTAGVLWLYKGDGASGYSPRTQIGTGWQIYTALASPGDLDGDGKADLVGRANDGVLWLYKGDGASYYSPRTQIGYGYPAGELLF
ncbi:FG-GAP-like repeat-containing protein [Streptomyces purpureus]|uniref:FG-GAP-like repeat-containing protein n=1 Tax=Streptomyces purpureus TaxID=1951 RepID=UPI0003728685